MYTPRKFVWVTCFTGVLAKHFWLRPFKNDLTQLIAHPKPRNRICIKFWQQDHVINSIKAFFESRKTTALTLPRSIYITSYWWPRGEVTVEWRLRNPDWLQYSELFVTAVTLWLRERTHDVTHVLACRLAMRHGKPESMCSMEGNVLRWSRYFGT